MPTYKAIKNLEKYLRNEQKKDIDRLAKALNSPELLYKPKAYILNNWVYTVNNFFEMLYKMILKNVPNGLSVRSKTDH